MSQTPRDRTGASLLLLLDVYFTKIWSLSLVAHVFVVAMLLLTPIDPRTLAESLESESNRFVRIFLKTPAQTPAPKLTPAARPRGGGKAKGTEGSIGRPDAKTPLKAAVGAPRINPQAREHNREVVQQTGLMRAFAKGATAQFSSVFGPGLGANLDRAVGRLSGRSTSDARGAGGLSTRGLGPGGGGESLGIGGIGDGDGFGDGPPDGVDLSGPRRPGMVPPPVRHIDAAGCQSRAVVGRVVSQQHSRARYCYEKRLGRNPNLNGKVTTRFVIGPTGAVRSVQVVADTVGDDAVAACLTKVIKSLRFPPCAGGGSAVVTYPWIFSTGGH